MAAKLGFELVKRAMLKELMKRGDDGIMLTLPKNELVDLNARITMDRLIKAGIDPDSLTSSDQVINILENINNQMMKNSKVISADSAEGKAITEKLLGKKGEVVSFKDKIEAMKKSGDIVDEDNMVISKKITDREMFKNSNLNKKDSVTETISYIKTLEPVKAMKEANSVIGRKGKYKNLTPEESKKILQDTEDHIFQRDPDNLYDYDPEDMAKGGRAGFSAGGGSDRMPTDYEKFLMQKKLREMHEFQNYMKNKDIEKRQHKFFEMNSGTGPGPILEAAKGGRAGHYTGGIVDVEPSLDDIGHGSDALMARTRLVSPGNQATTSTGLNYLLAEDNDNMRVPFSTGGGGRRAFLKLMATLGGGIAGLKSGLFGMGGKEAGKKAVTETVKQSVGSGTPPPYFFKLVEKIKTLGDETVATQDKAIAKKYKDYTMEEDFAGNIEIIKKGDDVAENVYMSYKVDEVPTKVGKKKSTKVEEYEEFTARPDAEGKMKDIEPGVPDEIIREVEAGSGNVPESFYTGPNAIKKAEGGRIGFSAGNLAKLGITGSSRRFLEKVFGKEKFATMIENDPRMHRGMLEVVEMFRKKDKEGLKKYMQKFLPDMDDATVEDFIIGGKGSEGIEGQLIRLGSGREYKNLINMKKEADQIRKLDDFDIDGVSKNAEGGRIGLFMGGGLTAGKGLLKNMLKFMSKDGSHKKSPAEILKMMNPKQYEKLLNNPKYQGQVSSEAPEGLDKIIQDMVGKTKTERSDMINDIISASRNIKKVDDDILNYKLKIIEDMVSKGIDREIAVEAAENISKEVAKSAGKKSTPKITEQGLLELENIQKNLLTKDRKLQAQGGLTTMLGE